MAVLTTYPLDTSGVMVSNKITGEVKTITKDADRVFIPTGGPFFTKSLKVWAGTKLLQPVTDYVALELNREGTLASGKEVCNVLFIKEGSTSFKIDYQVIGGEFSDYSNELVTLINDTPISNLNIMTWGSIFNKPTTYPPTSHVHYPYEWRGYTQVIHLLEQLRQLIVAGDQSQIAAIYQYIESNIKLISSDYIDLNGLFFINYEPTPNGNILLVGKGTESDPLRINFSELLEELDERYFQNAINPISQIGAISDNFLPISSGFFNALAPLNKDVSLSAVGNVERNGDLLMLTPATNGEITRYVYGYVRGWSNDPTISRYRPTNQQYRPPGLAANEEIMDLYGYHEQSMIGSIFTVDSSGIATFKENCVIWLNGTLAVESHVIERLGRELVAALPTKTTNTFYSQSPKFVKMRDGSKFLIYFTDNSGIHVYSWDNILKKFTQTKNWKAVLQYNTIDPDTDQKIDNVINTTETVIRTGQDFCRPFAWRNSEKIYDDEMTIFDDTINSSVVTSVTFPTPGLNRQRMSCHVVGDTIKVMANITYQGWIYDPSYRGGSRTSLGFSLEIMPKEATPTYKWIRHTREGGEYNTGISSSSLTPLDRGYTIAYETSLWTLVPMDVYSQWTWWDDLQPRTHLQLNDGRILVWAHPSNSGDPIGLYAPRYRYSGEYDVEKMFVLYYNTKMRLHPELGNGVINNVGDTVVNFKSPTVNKVNSMAIPLGDGTILLAETTSGAGTKSWQNVHYTAYRPSATTVDYSTATNGVVQGFDTSDDRIELVGDYNGYSDIVPWISARKADGTVKVGALCWYRPLGAWADQQAPANVRVDWAAKKIVREEMYTFTVQGYNAVEDYLRTKLAISGTTILHTTWTIIASPVDVNTGLLMAYGARDNRTTSEYIIPVKLQWDTNKRLSGINIAANEVRLNARDVVPVSVSDPRLAWSRLQWAIDYNTGMTQAYWAGKMGGVSTHTGDTMYRPEIYGLRENKAGTTSTWAFLSVEGDQNTTSGYKAIVATKTGVGMMTDTVGFGVYRTLQRFKGLTYASGTMFIDEKPFIYFTPRPSADFSLEITDTIDIQLGGVYGQIEPQTYSLVDPAVSDIVDPKNKTIFIYIVLDLGVPRVNFREVALAESTYTTYIGKCKTDEYGVMELDIKPVTRIGNYRPSATPQGSAFSVSSGTPDTERLLNWDANIFSSDVATNVEKGTMPEQLLLETAGVYEYKLGPGEGVQIEMLGSGGAGGNAAWTTENAVDIDGRAGTDSKLTVDGVEILVATGGKGGRGGIWANDSAYYNGVGGNPVYSRLVNYASPAVMPNDIGFEAGLGGVYTRWLSQPVGVPKVIGENRGGYGGAGSAPVVDGWANGGSGASGSYLTCTLRNVLDRTITIRFTVGKGGLVSPYGSLKGQPGKDGVIKAVLI